MIYLKRFDEARIRGVNGDYTTNTDGSINVYGNVELRNYSINTISEMPFKINSVSGSFNGINNNLVNLIGFPKTVGGDFSCSNNNVTSLEGCPDIGGFFNCSSNRLYDFYGMGKIGGNIFCDGNPVYEIVMLCGLGGNNGNHPNKKFIEYLNEFRPIRGKTILGKRLQECLYMCDKEVDVTTIKFKNYTLLE